MPLTPEEHEALEAAAKSSSKYWDDIAEKYWLTAKALPPKSTPTSDALVEKWHDLAKKPTMSSKKWPPPKVVKKKGIKDGTPEAEAEWGPEYGPKKKPASITVHPKDRPSYVISQDQWDYDAQIEYVEKVAEAVEEFKPKKKPKPKSLEHWSTVPDASDAWDAPVFVDADVEYPSIEGYEAEVKVPMQTRRSNKRVGLTCKAVQLLSKKLDLTCCEKCHDYTRRRPDHHEMHWVTTPASPSEFDCGLAWVCCHYRKVCVAAVSQGWEKIANASTSLSPKTVWNALITDAAAPGSHMETVVELTWLNSAPVYDGVILAKMGFTHMPQLRVHVKSPYVNAAAVPEEFCNNPRCVTCAWDTGSYWSYALQCWFRYNLYSIFDNAAKLTRTHQTMTDHSCAGDDKNGTFWVPEHLLWTCRYQTPDSLPVWGAQYDVNPKYHAAIKWWDNDDYDFRWIIHSADKDKDSTLSSPYKYLCWEVVGL